MKRLSIAILIILTVSGCYAERKESVFDKKESIFSRKGSISSKKKDRDTSLTVTSKKATDSTDIHYTGRYCKECHEKIPKRGGGKFLKFGGDFKQLCNCHFKKTDIHLHPVDITPSEKMKRRVPNDLPLLDGKLSCSTCHDIVAQCEENPLDKLFIKGLGFLRGAPFKTETDLCFRCHDKTKYKRFNPHKQVDEHEEIMTEKCLYCHFEVPYEKQKGFTFKRLIGDRKELCLRCHNKLVNQSFHAQHIRRPSAQILERMKQVKDEFNIILPLTDDGEITCVTCHNPHDRRLMPSKSEQEGGEDTKFRHRVSGNLCIRCHMVGQY